VFLTVTRFAFLQVWTNRPATQTTAQVWQNLAWAWWSNTSCHGNQSK